MTVLYKRNGDRIEKIKNSNANVIYISLIKCLQYKSCESKIKFINLACQCYGHSNNCTYDADIDANKLSIDIHGNYEGGGVCVDCQVKLKYKISERI